MVSQNNFEVKKEDEVLWQGLSFSQEVVVVTTGLERGCRQAWIRERHAGAVPVQQKGTEVS